MIPECPLEVRAQTMLVDLLTWLVLGGIRSEAQTMGHFRCWFHDTRTFGNSLQFATEALGHLWILYVEDDVSKIVIFIRNFSITAIFFIPEAKGHRGQLWRVPAGAKTTPSPSTGSAESLAFSRLSGGPRGLEWGTDIFNQGGNPWKFNQKHTKPQCDSNGHCGQRYANMLRW